MEDACPYVEAPAKENNTWHRHEIVGGFNSLEQIRVSGFNMMLSSHPKNPWALHGRGWTRHLRRGPDPNQTLCVASGPDS